MEYIMGLCGADSATNVSIATLSGVVVQSYTVGAINLFFATEKEAAHNLAEAFATAQLSGYPLKSCHQICAGIAGMQGAGNAVVLTAVLRDVMWRCGYTGDALLIDNEQIALAGAIGSAKGAIIMADSASTCYGQNGYGANHRTGGLGHLADDDGSAYAIGREILRTVARASDGRENLTHLTAHVYRKFSLASPMDLAKLLRGKEVQAEQICELASCLALACQAMDKVAQKIVEKASGQLVGLIEPVITRLKLQKNVLAVAGKVLLNDAFVGIAFKKKVNEKFPDLQCVPPRNDAVAGAVLLAKERVALRRHM